MTLASEMRLRRPPNVEFVRQTYEAWTPGSALREAFQGMAARRLGSSSVIIPPGHRELRALALPLSGSGKLLSAIRRRSRAGSL
jgi:hypothetical protein